MEGGSAHAIVYVSSKNQTAKGQLNNAGVTGISGYVDDYGTWSQKLMCREFPLPPQAEVLYQTEINFSVYPDEVDHDAPIEEKYVATKHMKIVVLHEKNRIDGPPYFSVEALDKARASKNEKNESIERSGEYLFFHVGGPVVVSEDKSTCFHLNENELSTCQGLFQVAYAFEDSFETRKAYKHMLVDIESR
jgi:hypothetical protein